MPNLSPRRPVEILSWLPASTSGFTRSATGAGAPRARATSSRRASSADDSTLNCAMPAANARAISARVLPTPAKTSRAGAMPAASARASSPPETTSAPAPRPAKVRITARASLALIE